MRSNIAKALSILGVVAAGSAATAINTQALQSSVDATVGDAAALLAIQSPVVPTSTITIFKTAAPDVAGPMVQSPTLGPEGSVTDSGTSASGSANNAQPPTERAIVGADEGNAGNNSEPVPEVSASPSHTSSHTSTGGSSYTSGDDDEDDDEYEDHEDDDEREDHEEDEDDD